MVGGMTGKPLIPLVELVTHYREFKSQRSDGVLAPGLYRSQEARLKLAESYIRDPSRLVGKFSRSRAAFSRYGNIDEEFIGPKRTDPAAITDIEGISSGPHAAAYLARTLPSRMLRIKGLGDYTYVDREIVPARTTARSATSANRFEDGSRSTRAMKADLLLRSNPHGRPTIGEVKVSSLRGDDADPVYGLVQALALASQLSSTNQRRRLRTHYEQATFAEGGPLDVVVFLFLIGERPGARTHRPALIKLAAELCARLDASALLPHIERVALVTALPRDGRLHFVAANSGTASVSA
jgi:hypothetical protein